MLSLFKVLFAIFSVALFVSNAGAGTAGPTDADIKSHISKKEEALATGVGSSHKSATLTFESIKVGKARKATDRDRLVNGITGPVVYPVRVRYTSNRLWGNGSKESKTIFYEYEFFKDSFDEWNSYMVGPVKN